MTYGVLTPPDTPEERSQSSQRSQNPPSEGERNGIGDTFETVLPAGGDEEKVDSEILRDEEVI